MNLRFMRMITHNHSNSRSSALDQLGLCSRCPLNPEAQKHFDAGVAYVDNPSGSKWEDALKEFRAAYAVSPNWKLLNNIGLCALNLKHDGEAIESYIGLAATGVFAAAGTVTGVLAMKKDKDYEGAIAAGPADADSIKKSGQTYALLTDTGVRAAVLSASVTAYLYFTAPKVTPEKGAVRAFICRPRSAPVQRV